jgi:hypothetical protein
MLYIIVIMLIYCVAFCLGWYSFFMNLPEKDPWYILLIYFLMSLFHVPMLLGTIAAMIYFVCKGVIDFFFEAWKDFTVDVELPV